MTNTNSPRDEGSTEEDGVTPTGDRRRTAFPPLGVATTVVTTVYTATQSLGATVAAALLTLVLDRRMHQASR